MLPKTKHPITTISIPSLGKRLPFRPWTVREEKILLVAKASTDAGDKLRAVYQVVHNCLQSPVEVPPLTTTDLEWVFLKLREFSTGGDVQLTYADPDGEDYQVTVSIPEIVEPERRPRERVVRVGEMEIHLSCPMASLYLDDELIGGDFDPDETAARCLTKVVDGEVTYDEFDAGDAQEFLLSLPIQTMDEIRQWVVSDPGLRHEVSYTNKEGLERRVELRSLADFFTL
jgi:hypothetical protein